MRGKGLAEAGSSGAEGITPAYAGKSLRYISSRLRDGDHPRLCGEKK